MPRANADRRLVLLDLAGDAEGARRWAEGLLPGAAIETLEKAELKRASRRAILARLRGSAPTELFAIYCSRADLQPSRSQMLLFGLLAGARRAVIGDASGRRLSRGWAGMLVAELPLLALEVIAGSCIVVPAAWLMVWLTGLRLQFRSKPRALPADGPLDILYLRATPAAAGAVGGSTSHIAGMVRAATGLGHRVRFIANDVLPEIDRRETPIHVVPPSGRFASVRAVFEVWNSLRFVRAARVLTGSFSQRRGEEEAEVAGKEVVRGIPDLIYQRYSRFNWAGVALSLTLGRPLCLEFNGSEVWVARNWDPVGRRRLLAAVERLNLRAASVVVVVSEVLADTVAAQGVPRERILVNPNGADIERFRPGAGGAAIRARLGFGDSPVAGFLGTFGPWHGVDILAEVIPLVDISYLLVGDGDMRESVQRSVTGSGASGRVVFAGRVAHSDVPAYLDACDILLSPHVQMPDGSAFFGSPTKLFEYMAMGRPIVASRLGQIGDVIENGVSGLLVTPGSVDELAAAVRRLAQDPELRGRLGAAARTVVEEHYTWRSNAERVVEKCRRTL